MALPLTVRLVMVVVARVEVPVTDNVPLKEGLLVMTQSKSGSLSVVNTRGKLVGVFTDGDFRRQIAQDENLLAKRLGSVMTPRPIRVKEEALAAEAVKIFDQRSIDDLIVVNAKNEPVGLVDSQDLPKMKLM